MVTTHNTSKSWGRERRLDGWQSCSTVWKEKGEEEVRVRVRKGRAMEADCGGGEGARKASVCGMGGGKGGSREGGD